MLTLVPFRASDIQVAFTYFYGLFTFSGADKLDISPPVILSFGFIAAMHIVELAPLNAVKDYYHRIPPLVRGLAYGFAVALLILVVPFSKGTFIYQQF